MPAISPEVPFAGALVRFYGTRMTGMRQVWGMAAAICASYVVNSTVSAVEHNTSVCRTGRYGVAEQRTACTGGTYGQTRVGRM